MTWERDVSAAVQRSRRRRDGSVYTVMWRHPGWYADVYRLWRLGLNDGQIGRALERKPGAIWTARHGMGLEANAAAGERTFPEVPYNEQQEGPK